MSLIDVTSTDLLMTEHRYGHFVRPSHYILKKGQRNSRICCTCNLPAKKRIPSSDFLYSKLNLC